MDMITYALCKKPTALNQAKIPSLRDVGFTYADLSGTTDHFISKVDNKLGGMENAIFFEEVELLDMPFAGNAEVKIEIISGIPYITLYSTNTSPYLWSYRDGEGWLPALIISEPAPVE